MEINAGEFLEKINFPSDLRALKEEDLPQVCKELRQFIIDIVSVKGGHFGASTGRRLPNPVYRAVIVIVGLIAFAKLISS